MTKNYTQSQLRNIEHTPLQLNPEEKKSIIYQILEQYWDYETPYYFFNQNCASEITDLLQGTLDPARMCRFKPMTPTQIQSELAKIGYLRPEESIFYRSSEDQLQKAYSALYENIWWDYTLHTYLNNTNALKRRKKIHKWIQSILDHQGFHASAYSLEQAAEQNLRQPSAFSHLYELELKIQSLAYLKLETKILAILSEAETPEIPVHDRKKKLALLHHYRESFTFLSSKNQLKNQINTGYGIPLETDLDLSKLQNGFHKIKKANQDINAWSQSVLKEDHLELDIIRRNLELLKECLAVETREDSHPVSKF